MKTSFIAFQCFVCAMVLAFLIWAHYQTVLYNNAFVEALHVVPELEKMKADSIPLSVDMISQINNYAPDKKAGDAIFKVLHYFRTHGSSPSDFSMNRNELHFKRKLPNAKLSTEFKLIFSDGVWTLDSIKGLGIVFIKQREML